MSHPRARPIALALMVGALAVVAGWLDTRYGWIESAFDFVAHLFYEVPLLARLRHPSQLVLTRWHLGIAAAYISTGLAISPWLSRHGRAWLAIFGLGYAIRAIIWICGSNLPLVPGDSCHYVEVATSVLRGEGPVKHYVESFFDEYRRILEGKGVLDDWATPLDAYTRALAMRIAGVSAEDSPEPRFAVAKACSFVLNLLALPVLYGLARRRFGPRVGIGAMAVLAVLPVHAIYAGFVLRESLVVLTSILAVWTLTEVWQVGSDGPRTWALAALAGLCAGLAILARNTAMAIVVASGLYFLLARRPRQPIAALVWMGAIGLVILPWALATYHEYGRPFYTYTSFFEYNFSWTVHHYEKGNTQPSQFYTAANLPAIVRVKVKSLLIIVVYSTMIVGLPVVAGFFGRLRRARPAGPRDRPAGRVDRPGLRAGDAQERGRRDPGRPARPVLRAGLRADAAHGGCRADRMDRRPADPPRGRPVAGGRLRGDDLGGSDLGLRRLVVHQAVPAPLAGDPRGRRLDPRASGSRAADGPDHDLVPLGAPGLERPDDRPDAPQLQPAADRGGHPTVRSHPFPLGFVRAAAV